MKKNLLLLTVLLFNYTVSISQCGTFYIKSSKDSVCAKELFSMEISTCSGDSIYDNYANSIANSTSDGDISKVRLNNGINVSTCASIAPGANSMQNRYSNYKSDLCFATIATGSIVPVEINTITCGAAAFGYGAAMFIDYNHNGIMDIPFERVFTANVATVPSFFIDTITIPVNAIIGKTLMRVITQEGVNGSSITASGTYNWGETEDYTINIVDSASLAASAITSFAWYGSNTINSLSANNSMVSDSNLIVPTNYIVVCTSPGCIDTIYKTIYPKSNNSVVYTNKAIVNSTSTPANGSINIVPFGGTSPYTYSWFPITNTSASVTSLGAGIYICTTIDANGCKTNDSITIKQINNTSINNSNKNMQTVTILPNPANQFIKITSKDFFTDVSIFNVLGTIVYFQQFKNKSEHSIDISNLPNGLYYLKTSNSVIQKLNIIR